MNPLLTLRVKYPEAPGQDVYAHPAGEGIAESEANGFLVVRDDDGAATALVPASHVIVLDMAAYRQRLAETSPGPRRVIVIYGDQNVGSAAVYLGTGMGKTEPYTVWSVPR